MKNEYSEDCTKINDIKKKKNYLKLINHYYNYCIVDFIKYLCISE